MPITLGESCAVLGKFLLGGSCAVPPVPAPFVLLTGFTDNGELTHNANGEMLGLSITRGIDPDQGTITVGTAQITLKNHDGRYAPLRTDSPLYPNVEVGRGVDAQIRDSAGDLQGQFKGTVREINLDPAPTTRQASLDCVDLLDNLRRVVVSTPLYEVKRSDELIAALLVLAGYTGATNFEQGVKVFNFVSWKDTPVLDAIQQVIDTEQGTFFISNDGVPTFHNRYHRVATTTPEATFNNSFDGFTYRLSVDDIFNEAIVTAHPKVRNSPGSEIWRWSETEHYLPPGQLVTVQVDFDGVAESYLTPSFFQNDFKTGSSPSTDDFPAKINVYVPVFNSAGATILLQNSAVGRGTYIHFFRLRGSIIRELDPVTAREVDQDSIDKYGFKSTITLDLPLLSSYQEAQSLALYLMQVYGNPIPRITLQVKPAVDERLDALANLDLNGIIEVTQPDLGLDGVLFFIDQIQSEMGSTVGGLTTIYSCTAVPNFGYIVLNSLTQTFEDILGA